MRILLIEDEPDIAAVVKQGLEEAGYVVDVAEDGMQGLDLAAERNYALILLDLMLPRLDGWRVCEELRARRDTTPILMLTARDAVSDRVRGLDLGADDYLPKPFDFDELLARVRALLRRDSIHKTRIIRIADLEIDTGTRRVSRAGQEIVLTPREYSLLVALAARQGRVLTRDVIRETVWADEDSYSNTVDVYIGLLRKKIDAGHEVKLIHTVHGLGYTLKVPRDNAPSD
ncbi:MAG: response regulator transcription factor [Abditibacteriales bacterium]|nr:response regulator transcription factor [Abditibacteriales bacterium]